MNNEYFKSNLKYEQLSDPEAMGVEIIHNFISPAEVDSIMREINNSSKIDWLDAHEVYKNERGLTITQNHFTFALKLSAGDQSILKALPRVVELKDRIQDFIRDLSELFPTLDSWQADELSFHLYDDQDVGLSQHRDNKRFTGLVAIASLYGECDFIVRHKDQDIKLPVRVGDLCLLRATELFNSDKELRPEHSVLNLKTDTRLSMMLRANNRPTEAIKGFKFNNWNP